MNRKNWRDGEEGQDRKREQVHKNGENERGKDTERSGEKMQAEKRQSRREVCSLCCIVPIHALLAHSQFGVTAFIPYSNYIARLHLPAYKTYPC